MEARAAVTIHGWLCPACGHHAVDLQQRFRAPADDHGGLIMIDLARCLICAQAVVAWWPGGATGSDGLLFGVDPAAWLGLQAIVQGCSRPTDSTCHCTAQCRTAILAGAGRWQGLRRLEAGGACAALPGQTTVDPRRLRLPWGVQRSLLEPWGCRSGGHRWVLGVDERGDYELRCDGVVWGSLADWPAAWIHPERPFGWSAA